MTRRLLALTALFATACGGDAVVAPPAPVSTAVYVLTTTNGLPANGALCTVTTCYQTTGDTIRLSSDSNATRTLVIRETARATGVAKDTPGSYHGHYFTLGANIYLGAISEDNLNGTIAADGLRLRGTYGDVYFYAKR